METEYTFEKYLIMVGIRSHEFLYNDLILFENIDYFNKCYNINLSAYKALLFLEDHINGNSNL